MIKLVLITIVIVGFAFLGLGLNIFFRKNKKFPQSSVGKNKKMRDLGLTCAKAEEIKCRNEINHTNYCSTCQHL